MESLRRLIVLSFALTTSAFASTASQSVRADFNGDGRVDKAWLIQHADYVEVRVLPNGSTRPQSLFFAVNAGVIGAICGLPASLTAETHDCKSDSGSLPGCKASNSAKGLRLSGGDCDAIHMYWDQRDGKMAWWSL